MMSLNPLCLNYSIGFMSSYYIFLLVGGKGFFLCYWINTFCICAEIKTLILYKFIGSGYRISKNIKDLSVFPDFLTKHIYIIQCFLEESRQLMRLPPRQSTAEADLMVPFQLVGFILAHIFHD